MTQLNYKQSKNNRWSSGVGIQTFRPRLGAADPTSYDMPVDPPGQPGARYFLCKMGCKMNLVPTSMYHRSIVLHETPMLGVCMKKGKVPVGNFINNDCIKPQNVLIIAGGPFRNTKSPSSLHATSSEPWAAMVHQQNSSL